MSSQPASDDTSNANEKIEVLYGAENIVSRALQDLVNVKVSFDNCSDKIVRHRSIANMFLLGTKKSPTFHDNSGTYFYGYV
jgi:hypothetical protein